MKNWLSFGRITTFFILTYLVYSLKSFYDIFHPSCCPDTPRSRDCIYQLKNWRQKYELVVCVAKYRPRVLADCKQKIFINEDLSGSFSKEVLIPLPQTTINNGTLTVYLILNGIHETTLKSPIVKDIKLSKYKMNSTNSFVNLLYPTQTKEPIDKSQKPITHLIKNIKINTIKDEINLFRNEIPVEILSDIKLDNNNNYLPIIHVDKLSVRDEDYMVLNKSQIELNVTLDYFPTSIGQLRFNRQLENSLEAMKELGFKDEQLNEIVSVFSEIDFKILLITVTVSAIHLLFEILSFKNDISFWRNRKSIVGLSVKTMFWRFISQIIIFLYLLVEETSYLVLVPSGVSVFIELWKLLKALKIGIEFNSFGFPKFKFSEMSNAEKETNNYDSIVMKKLSYVLYPLCIIGAIYSLAYNKYKNWYQWLINSLVNGVYAFGFLFMTPQLFLNYKMKSVAHLPWKSFMYKAFNTFIDDVFAFIIKMPTSHRLACLRDDVVFLVYLYQRWLYPIDKSRANEFGETFTEEEKPKTE